MRAAHAIWKRAQNLNAAKTKNVKELSVVGIPKTMDNDILWVWQSFGFLSAVEKAKEAIMQLHTEVTANPRICILQLFGSDSGFVVSHAALTSGACDVALIPEIEFTMTSLAQYVGEELSERLVEHKPYGGIIVMAETSIPTDWKDFKDEKYVRLTEDERKAIELFEANDRRVQGQTPDDLRSGGLKIVSQVLKHKIRNMGLGLERLRVFTNEPRHLIRAIRPSVSDITFAQRLGTLAVDNALAGYTDFMVSQWLTEYVLVPLKLVALGRKRVPEEGIFWKSVLANTGQPADLVSYDKNR
jgi:6-phosphofructokinase 1